MGLSFSSENKTKTRKEERVPYIDERRSYKRPKHEMSKTMMNVLASENVVSFSMKKDAMSLALSCENAYENISQMNSYWYAQSVSVGAGDWNWFFMKNRKKIPGKSWLEVHNFLIKEKARYVLNDLKDAFPENLSFGKKETWKKCKLNRDALNFAFSDLVHLFPAFNEGRGDRQCDVYPIGIEAYIREPGKGPKDDIVSEKRGEDLFKDIQCLGKHLEDFLYDPLNYASWDVEETYETLTGKAPSLRNYLNDPHVNVVHFRADGERDDVIRSCRILFSKMFSYVLQVHFPSIMKDHLKTLRVLHTAIENAFEFVEDADNFPEEKNGVRPDDDDDWGILYTSDLVKPFQDALSDVVPKIKEGTVVTADMFPFFPSDSREWSVEEHMDSAYPRLRKCASAYLKRVHQSLGGKDDDETKFLYLSDSDRMPSGPNTNDHNGIVYFALLTCKFAWVVMGKSDSC